jgi:signal transduction histidine kinase
MQKESQQGHEPLKRRERIKLDLLIHDLKVPLAIIEAGIGSLLTRKEKYGGLTEKQARVLARVLRNTKVTQSLVADALELGRSREGIINLSRCSLAYLVGEALTEVFDLNSEFSTHELKGCENLKFLRNALLPYGLSLRIDEALWCREVHLDEPKVRQILRNLLNNALKYRKRTVELEVSLADDCLFLAVKDDGAGIPASYHRKIFECYFQMNNDEECPVRGHGVGLAGVLVLVEDMGGRLLLESDQGKGAKFTVKLPLQ